MRLLTKIKFAAVLIAVIPTVGICLIGFLGSRKILLQGLEARVQGLATAVAAGVDPEMIAVVGASHDIGSAQYVRLEKLVRLVTSENQLGDEPIRFVYLLTPSGKGATSQLEYAVDSDPHDSKDWSAPGTPYKPIHADQTEVLISLQTPSFDYIHDEQGDWLSGFAPIRSSDGRVIGLAAADISYKEIVHQADYFLEIALVLAVLCAGFTSFAVDRMFNKLTAPVGKICAFIRNVGEGELSLRLEKFSNREIDEVVGELNEMTSKLEGRERLAKENVALAKNVAAFAQIDSELNHIQDIDILMERILLEARRLIGCDAGSVMLREGKQLSLKYVQNDTLPNGHRLDASASIPVNDKSIAGYAAMSGESVNIEDAYAIPTGKPYSFNKSFDLASGYRTRSMLTIPLVTSAKKNVGVLQLLNPIDEDGKFRAGFSTTDIEAILHFASAATVALERAGLTRSLINRMIKMAELRDPSETGVHCDRVAAYSVILYEGWAKRHGIQGLDMERERDVLRIAARLHDVGKVAIPDAILKKPGRLTAEEYSVMQTHTTEGARLFRQGESVYDYAAMNVTLHHHQRWDGGGYPGDRDGEFPSESGDAPPPTLDCDSEFASESGDARPSKRIDMKGQAIPLFARIVSVADVFDALSSKRMYKEAWPEDRVLTEMKVNAGKQFDPELIEILFEQIEEIRAASARYESAED